MDIVDDSSGHSQINTRIKAASLWLLALFKLVPTTRKLRSTFIRVADMHGSRVMQHESSSSSIFSTGLHHLRRTMLSVVEAAQALFSWMSSYAASPSIMHALCRRSPIDISTT
ncbi:unnamed protein product [Anisakis simplex]|uniref:Secreted protein n=1 Tax=Anisakis simplex TaxID=6269 RepID=A0A0M3K2J2_ANISI|nr:unnamed protein product [Anisakis simplex]